jgi:hypothetical protein
LITALAARHKLPVVIPAARAQRAATPPLRRQVLQ